MGKEIDIRIELKPATDGIVNFPSDNESSKCSGVIIGTDGSYKKVDLFGALQVIREIPKEKRSYKRIDDNVYFVNDDALLYTADGRYLVGSTLGVKTDDEDSITDLNDDEVEEILENFKSYIEDVEMEGYHFPAFYLE
ncbi:MAG: hypothetical protein K5894_16015 [Lachnospiraceae bacterium]|nr:hypothetical protein [Lachnospiraceae bacterium]